MALKEIVVDPSIAADSGAGTELDPYGDLEFAIESETFGASGTRISVIGGTDEVLAAEIGAALIAASWTPSATAPLIIEGCTASPGDGGIGGISGGGSVSILTQTAPPGDYITFKNMHLHNSGAARLLDLGDRCLLTVCELDTCSEAIAIRMLLASSMNDCYVHDITSASQAVYFNNPNSVGNRGNFIEYAGAGDAVRLQTTGIFESNIVIVTGNANGINAVGSTQCEVRHNSVFSTNNSNQAGIAAQGRGIIENNTIEGFSAAGGYGIEFTAAMTALSFRGNAVYDCETEYGTPDFDYTVGTPDNETLTASPFTSAATGNFAPVDTGNVKEGSLPSIIGGNLV